MNHEQAEKLVLQAIPVLAAEQMFDVRNRAGETVQVPMLGQHVFSVALAMAVAVLKHGWFPPITRAAFESVSKRSAVMSVLQQIEGSLGGAGTPPLFLWGLVAEDIVADESLP